MTSLEARQLKIKDIVTLGKRIGHVISKSSHTITILWDDGHAVQYEIDKKTGEISIKE
jgi:hypothetical protein